MRYYSTQRPVGPGTFPQPKENKVLDVHNFDGKTYCEELGREAWGYIDYEQALSPEQAASYELTAPKVLYFEGAGWSGADISKATIGNCRIRTAFHLDDGRAVYLEIIGNERSKYSPSSYQWQYTGFVTDCHYITDDKPNDDCNKHHVMLPKKRGTKRGTVEDNTRFEYTEAEILRLVNILGASFTAIKVVPDLGGYRVFREKYTDHGPGRYNYGDEFPFDPDMTARREAVYRKVYQIEEELAADRQEGSKRLPHSPGSKDYPCFSLWVDRDDPGLLHLLRHFIGCNKHWTIRTDAGETLEEWMATMTEAHLGKYGC